jgi:hypothetical protein
MNYEILVRILDGLAHGAEQMQPLFRSELVDPAIIVDPNAIHILHHQIRQAVVGDSAVQKTRDARGDRDWLGSAAHCESAAASLGSVRGRLARS